MKAVCICSDGRANRRIIRGNDNDENDNDELENSIVDLALPASTNTASIVKQLRACKFHDGLTVIFSTYQSIDIVAEAQTAMLQETNGEYGTFDFIVCDEVHRTTGVKISSKDESNFTKIHKNDFIRGCKRLYMTATPRLYGEQAIVISEKKESIEKLLNQSEETKEQLDNLKEELNEVAEETRSYQSESSEAKTKTIEYRDEVKEFVEEINEHQQQIEEQNAQFEIFKGILDKNTTEQGQYLKDALKLIEQSKLALSYTTSVGLSTSFDTQCQEFEREIQL